MAHFRVGSNGSIHIDKTKKEKEQQAAKAKKQAASQLKEARSSYQNYVSGERNRILSNQNKKQISTGASLSDRLAPIDQLRQKQQERRNKQKEQNNYNKYVTDRLKQDQNRIKYGPDELPGTNKIQARKNDLEQRASKNAAALKQASQTDTAKELKKDIRLKQNEYNVANYLENQAKVDQEKTNNFDRLVNPIASGLGELTDFSRLTGTQDVYDYETGKRTFLPNRREIKQQKVRRDSKGAWGVYNDVSYNMSKAIGAKILDTVTFGGGTALYYGNMVGDAAEEARQQGFSKDEALLYGGTVGVIGATLDKALDSFGGLSAFSNKVPTLTQGVDKFFYKMLGNKTASTLLSNVTREAFSEFAEEYADNIAKYMINADATDADSFMDMIAKTTPDAMYSGLIGGISGGVGRFVERNTQDMQERLNALDDYKATLEGIQPQSIPEAQYKEDQLTQVDNQINEINTQMEQNQTAPNTIEQQEQFSQQSKTQEQPQIVSSTEKKKEGQLQYNFNEEIKTEGKKLNMSDKQITRTQNEVGTFQNNIVTKDSSLQKAYETGNIALTKKGDVIKVSNEKDIQQLIDLTVPTEKKVTVKAKDLYGEDYTIKKQSQKFLEGVSTNEELFNKLEENKTTKQKNQDKKDAIRYEKTFENFKNAIDSEDTERSNEWEKVQDEHIVKSFSLDELQKQAGEEIREDIDKVKEEVDASIINKTADKHNMAQAAALASYYSGKGDWKNADKYRWKASSISSMFGGNLVSTNLLYLDNPDGALNAYLAAVDETYKEDAKYHKGDIEWHNKNDMINPDGSINENSPYRLKDEVKDELRAKIQEWYKIENATSKEAKIKQKEIKTLIQQNLPDKPFGQKLLNFRRTAMLNNIGIWVRNSRQEVIDVTNAVTTDIGASVADKKMEKLRNKIENKVREEQGLEKQNKRYRTTSITTVKAGEFMQGYKNGAKNHIESLKNDINMNRFGTRYDTNTNKISKSKVSSVPEKITRESTNKFVIFLEKMNAVGMSSDTRFAEGYYAQAIYDMQAQFASNKAANKGVKAVVRTEIDASGARITYIDPETGGIQNDIVSNIKNNEELEIYIKENKYNLFEQSEIDAILDSAEKEANYRTLQDTGSLSKLSLTLVDKINEWSIEHLHYPLGSHFVPFIKASTESLRLSYNSTPLALININKDIKNFKNEVELNSKGIKTDVNLDIMQREISKKLGQAYGGTFCTLALLTAAAGLYGAGKLSGAQPDEKEGEEKYSIKIRDKNYSFDIDSITMFKLKMASVLTDKKNISKTNNTINDIEQTINNFASPVLDAVLEQTIISSFGEYFDKKYGTRWDTLAYQFVRLPQSFIPTLSKNIAVALDGFKNRDTSSDTYLGKMINGIGSKLPGIHSLYEEKKNEWGSVEDASLNIFEKAWNTMISNDISANKTTKVDKELYDLYITTKSAGLFPSAGLKNNFSRGNNKYELNEKELKKYQNTYATTSFNMLEKLIDNQQYKKANQKEKTLMVKAVYRHAQEVGQNEYLKNKNISVTTDKSAIERVIEQNISYDSAIYQKKNPTRWKLYTSIVSDYDNYKTIESRINEIKDTYSYDNGFNNKTQLNMVVDYINGLNNLSSTQKAMLIRMSDRSATYKKSYSSYDSKIDNYLKNLHLSDEEYEYFINGNNLALKGYYGTYYTSKKNK